MIEEDGSINSKAYTPLEERIQFAVSLLSYLTVLFLFEIVIRD